MFDDDKKIDELFSVKGQENTSAQDDKDTTGTFNFDILESKGDSIDNVESVPYDFRPQYTPSLLEENLQTEKRFRLLKWHAIGLGSLIGVLFTLLISFFLFNQEKKEAILRQPIIYTNKHPIKVRPEAPSGMDIPNKDKTIYKRINSDTIDTSVKTIDIPDEKPILPQTNAKEPLEKPVSHQTKTKEGEFLGKPVPTSQEMEWEVLSLKNNVVQTTQTVPSVNSLSKKEKQDVLSPKTKASITESEPKVEKKLSPAKLETTSILNTIKSKEETTASTSTKQITSIKKEETSKTVPMGQTTFDEKEQKTPVKEEAIKENTLPIVVWHVQLMSMTSKNAISKAWPTILKKNAQLLSGLPHDIQEIEIKGKRFYRLRVGEFKDKQEAQNLCTKLKDQKQDCSLTK